MAAALPQVTRDYVHHHLDSRRWRIFEPRDDDIIVTTSYKSGTTWMQQILYLLIFKEDLEAPPLPLTSPWLDARFHGPLEEVRAGLAAQTHRRFVKSHLPFDGLPYFPNVKYVIVARDTRDVFMSLWNHYSNYTDAMMERLNDQSEWSGKLLARAPENIRQCWRDWISRGWFPWESEGWPFWSNLHHTQSYWDFRQLDNLLFVHYSDLLADPAGQIQRVAAFLDISLASAELEQIIERSSFDHMKAEFKEKGDALLRDQFKGGSDAFIYKGTNGRWRDELSADDLALYEDAKRRVLSPDCAAWLESGWLGAA